MIQELANQYFELLAENFPVMTGSDEFYFFPRIESSKAEVESFAPELIMHLAEEARSIKTMLEKIIPKSIKDKIDQRVLGISLNNFIFHMDEFPLWRRDPTLYLRILIIGLDEPRFPEDGTGNPVQEWAGKRLDSIAKLLGQAVNNLIKVPDIHREVGLEMLHDVMMFLADLRRDGFFKRRVFNQGFSSVILELDRLKDRLEGLDAKVEAPVGRDMLERILNENLGWPGPLDAAREEIEDEISSVEANLFLDAKKIDPEKSPDDFIQGLAVPHFEPESLLSAYRVEVGSLKEFIIERGLLDLSDDPGVDVEFTPRAMRCVRSDAAYSAPLSQGRRPGKYYILPLPRRPHTEDQAQRLKFIHRQIKFVSAHETYPGHHLIDLARLRNPNPVRRAFELPLVYEGWACYSESILHRAGFFTDPSEAMLLNKRRWWRAMRGLADLEFQSGDSNLEESAKIIVRMGLPPQSALFTARRFALNPGYQMCYTLGTKGFYGLYDEFAESMSDKEFHSRILEEGEIPFDVAREKLKILKVINRDVS